MDVGQDQFCANGRHNQHGSLGSSHVCRPGDRAAVKSVPWIGTRDRLERHESKLVWIEWQSKISLFSGSTGLVAWPRQEEDVPEEALFLD
jgi:hypothetical protein